MKKYLAAPTEFVSIIIPIKDEPAIQELIYEINNEIKQSHEIIIVDKSSVEPKIEGAKVIAQSSNGLGNAFVEGLFTPKVTLSFSWMAIVHINPQTFFIC